MLQHCEHYASNTNRYDVWDGECGGTVASLMYFSNSLDEKTRFCPPKAATNGQAGRVVVAYLRAHPEMLHLDLYYSHRTPNRWEEKMAARPSALPRSTAAQQFALATSTS
jgi:hypothetical protein